MIDENNYLKHKTFFKKGHNENRKNKKTTITKNEIFTPPKQPKIETINSNKVSKYENHANIVIGPRNVGKTYYILRILEK